MLRLLLPLATLSLTAESAVSLTNSILFDEFDLSGKQSLSIDADCRKGCKIYVSSVKNADFIDKLAFKVDDKEGESFTKYTYEFDDKSRQKIALMVKQGSSVSIVNSNADFAVGPVVIYVVSSDAPNFDTAGVYDISTTYRDENVPGKIVTVMGAKPFTVWASSGSEAIQASIYTAGFDFVEEDKCQEAYTSVRGQGIKYAVNGPITTLFFKEEVPMNVDFLDFFETDLDLTSATFISSPGYIGCYNSQVYHSSLYPTQSAFTFVSDIPRNVRLEGYLNTEEPLKLVIDGDATSEKSFTGSIDDASTYQRAGAATVTSLVFSYTSTDADQSFFVRIRDLGMASPAPTRRTIGTSPTVEPVTYPTVPTTSRIPTTSSTTQKPTTSGTGEAAMVAGLVLLSIIA